jgi:lysophospholipase
LIGIPEAPVPEGGRAVWLEGRDGARLRAALFPPQGAPRGSVVLSPGRTEPIEKYFEVIGELQQRGLHVLAHDWRGQGLSARALPDRLKGHARGYAAFLSDFSGMLDRFEGELPRPWISLAHSMGGGLALLALSRGEDRFAGAVCTAPMIGLYQVRAYARVAGLIARVAVLCGLSGAMLQTYDPLAQGFEGNVLTHDRARFERYMAQLRACPDLALGGPTLGWLDYALSAGRVLSRPSSAARVRAPFTLIGAGEDKLVLAASARRFAEAAPRGRYVEIEAARHEILMESDPIRAAFWREFDAFAGRAVRPPSA